MFYLPYNSPRQIDSTCDEREQRDNKILPEKSHSRTIKFKSASVDNLVLDVPVIHHACYPWRCQSTCQSKKQKPHQPISKILETIT